MLLTCPCPALLQDSSPALCLPQHEQESLCCIHSAGGIWAVRGPHSTFFCYKLHPLVSAPLLRISEDLAGSRETTSTIFTWLRGKLWHNTRTTAFPEKFERNSTFSSFPIVLPSLWTAPPGNQIEAAGSQEALHGPQGQAGAGCSQILSHRIFWNPLRLLSWGTAVLGQESILFWNNCQAWGVPSPWRWTGVSDVLPLIYVYLSLWENVHC